MPSHFFDSGSFTLRTTSVKWGKANGRPWRDYYETTEFWEYVDAYAEFVKEHRQGIDLFVNVDVIPDAELTWRNQQYLEEKHGLRPVPVVHFGTDLKWLQRYIDEGHELIGLGGLVRRDFAKEREAWIGRCFDLICDNPQRLPVVKLHGFGVTSYPLLIRYPWWSVDSSSWAKVGAFGQILVPHKRAGKFDFEATPYSIDVSIESKNGDHYNALSPMERSIVREWLDEIGVPLGKMDGEDVVEYGVTNRHTERRWACLLFFERLRDWLPAWPWPFRSRVRGFSNVDLLLGG